MGSIDRLKTSSVASSSSGTGSNSSCGKQEKFRLRNLRRPCCGLFLRGSVKHIAIINSFLATANMTILGATVVDLWPGYYDNLPPIKRYSKEFCLQLLDASNATIAALFVAARLTFLAYFYCFWIFEFYHSVVLYRASKHHDVATVIKWLKIQIVCYFLFISAYASHCFWIVGMDWRMEGAISRCFLHLVSTIYKPYTFWVIWSFVKEVRRNGSIDAVIKRIPDSILEDCAEIGSRNNSGCSSCARDLNVEIDRESLTDFVRIGGGVQSNVYRASYLKFQPPKTVAVKVTKGSRMDYFKGQLEDLRIRASMQDHENVVKLYGACTKDILNLELYIVMEFCPLGSLDTYLERNQHNFRNQLDSCGDFVFPCIPGNADMIQTEDLVAWCLQAARGLAYLHSQNIIHNDMAARNLLLSANRSVKLTDFGYSIQLGKSDNYARSKQTYVPLLWMAPETLSKMPQQLTGLSYESDIWSFGITMWEMFTFGEEPHGEFKECMLRMEMGINSFINKLASGATPRPDSAPNAVFKLMLQCWNSDPKARPACKDIAGALQSCLDKIPKASIPVHLVPERRSVGAASPICANQANSYVAFGFPPA